MRGGEWRRLGGEQRLRWREGERTRPLSAGLMGRRDDRGGVSRPPLVRPPVDGGAGEAAIEDGSGSGRTDADRYGLDFALFCYFTG